MRKATCLIRRRAGQRKLDRVWEEPECGPHPPNLGILSVKPADTGYNNLVPELYEVFMACDDLAVAAIRLRTRVDVAMRLGALRASCWAVPDEAGGAIDWP